MNTDSAPIDIVTIGNATIDAFLTLQDASSHCRVNQTSSELCVTFGQKIPLDGCEFQVGGNAANVAVGLSRSGLQVGLMAEIGKDEFATKITNTLTHEGVNLSYVQQKGLSTFAMGLHFQGERTIFVQHQTREHDFSFTGLSPRLIYLTSIGNQWEDAYAKTLLFVKETHSLLAFNPGTLQIQKGKDGITDVLQAADIVFLNKEELGELFSVREENAKDLLLHMRDHASGLIVLTNGKDGAYASTKSGEVWHIPSMEATIVEKTGAGDAFASGFLTGFLQKKSIAECLQYGTLNAVGVMGKVGAQSGLLNAGEYEQQLVKAPVVTQL